MAGATGKKFFGRGRHREVCNRAVNAELNVRLEHVAISLVTDDLTEGRLPSSPCSNGFARWRRKHAAAPVLLSLTRSLEACGDQNRGNISKVCKTLRWFVQFRGQDSLDVEDEVDTVVTAALLASSCLRAYHALKVWRKLAPSWSRRPSPSEDYVADCQRPHGSAGAIGNAAGIIGNPDVRADGSSHLHAAREHCRTSASGACYR